MKIKPSFHYQIREHVPAVLVYYGILIAMILLSLLFIPFAGDSNFNITTSGVTAVTMIFSFIVSLCAFKDSFLLNLQHGASRRTQFLARLGASAAICAALAVADEVYTLLMALLSFAMPDHFIGHSLYEMLYVTSLFETGSPAVLMYSVGTNTSTVLCSVVFSFFVLLAVCSFGYLIAVFNYRLKKMGKIIFWVGWPFLFIAACSFLDAHPQFANSLVPVLTNISRLCLSTLPRLCVTCTLLAALFSGCTWLFLRRAVAK